MTDHLAHSPAPWRVVGLRRDLIVEANGRPIFEAGRACLETDTVLAAQAPALLAFVADIATAEHVSTHFKVRALELLAAATVPEERTDYGSNR